MDGKKYGWSLTYCEFLSSFFLCIQESNFSEDQLGMRGQLKKLQSLLLVADPKLMEYLGEEGRTFCTVSLLSACLSMDRHEYVCVCVWVL